jgi:uncharacterized membrane protein
MRLSGFEPNMFLGIFRSTRGSVHTRGSSSTATAVGEPASAARHSVQDPLWRAGERVEAFDAARGAAMLLVCLSHFTTAYLWPAIGDASSHLLFEIGMVASPTFIALSGMMVGLTSVLYRRSFRSLQVKLTDRALFILTVGHLLLIVAEFARSGSSVLRSTQMTDVVAVCLVIALWLTPVTRPRTRVGLGLAVLATAWILIFRWTPAGTSGAVAKEILVGTGPEALMSYTVPVLQWLGVYLICTALGQRIGSAYARHDRTAVERTFAVIAVASIATAAALRISSSPFRALAVHSTHPWAYGPLFSPWAKNTAGPVYILFFGGLGMALVYVVVIMSHRQIGTRALRSVAQIGRSSLATFLVQQYLYFSVLWAVSPRGARAWPVVFIVSLIPVFVFGRVWDKRQLNAKLTVGLRSLLENRFAHAKPAERLG